jgi:hypothetical protein
MSHGRYSSPATHDVPFLVEDRRQCRRRALRLYPEGA